MRRIVLVSVPVLVGLFYLTFAFAVITGTMRRKEGDDPPIDPGWEQVGHWLVVYPLGYFVPSILVLPLVHAVLWATIVYVLLRCVWKKQRGGRGPNKLAKMDAHFKDAINTNRGVLTNQPLAEAHDLEFEPLGV